MKFGKGPKPTLAYTNGRLTKLLNLDLENEVQVETYCNEFRLVLIPINSTYSAEVKKVVTPIKEIVDFFIENGYLKPDQLTAINQHLKGITFQLNRIDPKDLKTINYLLDPSLDGFDYQIENTDIPQYGFSSTHANSIVSLWEELAKLIVRNQRIQSCANCGTYFTMKAKSHGQRYCSTNCQEKYKKKRQYSKRK